MHELELLADREWWKPNIEAAVDVIYNLVTACVWDVGLGYAMEHKMVTIVANVCSEPLNEREVSPDRLGWCCQKEMCVIVDFVALCLNPVPTICRR